MAKGQRISEVELCRTYNLGIVEYDEALRLQEQLVKARLAGDLSDTILFLQHPPVLTIGAARGEQNIIASKDLLANEGVTIYHTDRGGDITYHGPGQLVGYLIFNLETKGRDLHQYVRNLEEVIIRTLRDYCITAHRDPKYPGVWVGDEKICALGIRFTRWVTKHGFALNINNELQYFSYIHPCGITDRGVTSMSLLLEHELIIEDVISCIIKHSSQVFNMVIQQESSGQLGKYYQFRG